MPFSKINITLTAAQVTAIQAAINALKNPANLPVQFNLTKEERGSLQNINNTRYPYVQRTMEKMFINEYKSKRAGISFNTLLFTKKIHRDYHPKEFIYFRSIN